MKFGAIDIGTNAARLLVGELTKENGHTFVKKISYTRVPLRLGEEVFTKNRISKKKCADFVKTIQAFKLISEIFEVKELRACATSAMREAKNAQIIRKKIKEETDVDIEIISGDEEGKLIFGIFDLLDIDRSKPFVVIDVGGGSTEITVFEKDNIVASKSFALGTLRLLKEKTDKNIWNEISEWIDTNVDKADIHDVYGTGGNINKLHKLIGGLHMQPILLENLIAFKNDIKDLTIPQRVEIYQLKPDRADVILPACEIYIHIMKAIGQKEILVPKIGLSDGIIYDLTNRARKHKRN